MVHGTYLDLSDTRPIAHRNRSQTISPISGNALQIAEQLLDSLLFTPNHGMVTQKALDRLVALQTDG